MVSSAVAFLSVPIYTHVLKMEEYGLYALAASSIALANVVLFHWVTAATARLYPSYLHDPARLVGIATRWLAGGAGAVLLAAGIVAAFVSHEMRPVVLASAGMLASTAFYEFGLELSRSALRPSAYAAAVACYSLCGLGLGVLLAMAGFGPASPILGLAGGQAIAFAVLIRLGVVRASKALDESERSTVFRHMLVYGLPLSGALVLSVLISTSDRYLIKHFLGLDDVAVYAASYALVFPGIVMVASVINLTGYPRIMRAYEAGQADDLDRLLREQITIILSLLLPVLCAVFILARPAADILPAGRYSGGILLAPMITAAAVLNVIRSTYVDLSLHISKKVIWLTFGLLVSLTFGVVANFLLLPIVGIGGAAIALCICYCVALVISIAGARKFHPLPMPSSRSLCAITAGLAAMVVALIASPSPSTIPGLAMVACVGGVAYLLGYAAAWTAWRVAVHEGGGA